MQQLGLYLTIRQENDSHMETNVQIQHIIIRVCCDTEGVMKVK